MRYHSMAALRFFFPDFSSKYRRRRSPLYRFVQNDMWKSVILNVGSKNILQWIFHFWKRAEYVYRHPRDFMLAAFPQWCTLLWKGSFNEWNLLIVIVWESYRWNVKDKNILREINVLSKGCFCLLLYSGFTNVLALKHMCKCTC